MKMFRSTVRVIFRAPKPNLLGRWGRVNETQMKLRVDRSNEDNCACGEMMKKKRDVENKKNDEMVLFDDCQT